MAKGKFATAINCMDDRTQIPVIEFLKEKYGVAYVDDVTEAGPDRILDSRSHIVDSIKERVTLSVKKHDSHLIAVVGHHDCAGNPVDKEVHFRNIRDAMKRVSGWFDGVHVVGLWVDSKWAVHEIR